MRILQLEIHDIRGIRSLALSPNGKNLVVWGPNGSGKSAVVDAVDFLLTGQVSRLRGKGTGGLSLAKHGPHIDSTAANATVAATLQIPGIEAPVRLMRCMSHPDYLECPEEHQAAIQPILQVAQRGQHVLSRREILRFITAEGATRADEIQSLLSLSEIEEVRKALVKVRNDADKELEAAARAVGAAKAAINVTLDLQEFDPASVLVVANRERAILGTPPISAAESQSLKVGVTLPKSAAADQSINVTLLERDFDNLARLLAPESIASRLVSAEGLASTVSSLKADPQKLRDVSKLRLIEIGLTLLDESGSCPLCEAPWPQGQLAKSLELRMESARLGAQASSDLKTLATRIGDDIGLANASLPKLEAALQSAKIDQALPELRQWAHELSLLQAVLADPIDKYDPTQTPPTSIAQLLAPPDSSVALQLANAELQRLYPVSTPEQTAWDTLTRLEENLKALELSTSSLEAQHRLGGRAHALHDAFLSARDSVLGSLYDSIAVRFTELYRDLHGDDEATFAADIHPDGAALAFNVDFYGRGTHPPHALHSEGHQDSMGLCLYLALAERLNRGAIDLTILDDVVMSVDSGHRRRLCELLARRFPQRQFLITTHDKTWAHQLRREGIVNKEGSVEFYNWSLATGPHVSLEADMWPRIQAQLGMGDVASAASLLRRGSEEYFAYACDMLEAQVKFRLDGRNDLGDYLPSAVARYRTFLRNAKSAAQSWSHDEVLASLIELESIASSVFQRANFEQWTVNASLHFNVWENLTPAEFEPVAEAFQDLHGLFACQQCGAMIRLAKDGYEPSAVMCNCAAISWNLRAKT